MSTPGKPIILTPSSPFDEAVVAFRGGGLIVYPTETFYGLGADPFNPEAIKKLFLLKGRPAESPVSVIVKDVEMLSRITARVPPLAARLMDRFWPGPLTIVFDALPGVPDELTAKTGAIAARVSSNPVCRRLLDELDAPITATSANPSGKDPAASVAAVLDYFESRIDILIDGGPLAGGAGSTIVDCRGDAPVIVRHGRITEAEIMRSL